MYSNTEENYLKAIFKLQEKNEEPVSTNSVAAMLNTKAASVTDMIRKLAAKKLIRYEKYKGVTLTEKGEGVAISTVRKHRLWEVFLYEKLKFGWDEVHEVAEQLEHIHSELLIDKMDDFLGNPAHDPHGDPIPTKKGELKKSNLILLSALSPKRYAMMSGVVDHSAIFLKYLDKLGIALGKSLMVIEVNEFDGSVKIKVDKKKEVSVSKDVARNILVKPKGQGE